MWYQSIVQNSGGVASKIRAGWRPKFRAGWRPKFGRGGVQNSGGVVSNIRAGWRPTLWRGGPHVVAKTLSENKSVFFEWETEYKIVGANFGACFGCIFGATFGACFGCIRMIRSKLGTPGP